MDVLPILPLQAWEELLSKLFSCILIEQSVKFFQKTNSFHLSHASKSMFLCDPQSVVPQQYVEKMLKEWIDSNCFMIKIDRYFPFNLLQVESVKRQIQQLYYLFARIDITFLDSNNSSQANTIIRKTKFLLSLSSFFRSYAIL